jgi:hypothetical protein
LARTDSASRSSDSLGSLSTTESPPYIRSAMSTVRREPPGLKRRAAGPLGCAPPPPPACLSDGGREQRVPSPVTSGARSAQEVLYLFRVAQFAEVVDGADKRAQREVIVTLSELVPDRLGRATDPFWVRYAVFGSAELVQPPGWATAYASASA